MGTHQTVASRASAILWACLASACGSEPAGSPEPPRSAAAPTVHETAAAWTSPPSEDATGTCVDCHTRITIDWSRTGMARSLGPVVRDELQDLGPVVEPSTGYRYAFEQSEDRASIVETHVQIPQHQLRAELAFAIGSGERDRAFAARQGESLWLAPLEVLTTSDGRRHSEMAPSHSITPGSRFTGPLTGECLGCHTDALPPAGFPLNLQSGLRSDGAPVWEPRGISCGACHGQVERHASARESEEGEDPILRIGELTRVQRLSICAACHLQGDARVVLEPGQLGPPRPGGDVLDRRALFVAAEPDQEIGFVSQVQRLVLSPCFLESESMDCTTCHDPHRTLHDEKERMRVRAKCLDCHSEPEGAAPESHEPGPTMSPGTACSIAPDQRAADRDCASCHMRRTGVFDVAEVQIHDHFIQRTPGEPSPARPLRFAESPEAEWKRFTWPGESEPEDVDDPGIWMMGLYARGHLDRATTFVDQPVSARVGRLPMYHHVRGSLLEGAGRTEEARAAYEHALVLDPATGPSATNLGLLLGGSDPAAGIRILDELLARFPKADGALRNRAVLHHRLGDMGAFARDLQAAHELHPNPALAATLASLAEQKGDASGARMWRQQAHHLDPLRQPPVRR